jgi:hypothetical protein
MSLYIERVFEKWEECNLNVLYIVFSFLLGCYFRKLILKLRKASKWYQKRVEKRKQKERQRKFAKKMKDLEIK